jgi:hypothetical protein
MRRRLSRLGATVDARRRPEPRRDEARFSPPIHARHRAAHDQGEGACGDHEPEAHTSRGGIFRASGRMGQSGV